MKKLFNLSVLLYMLIGCNKPTVDNSVINDFDFNRFLGNWYEIARFDHRFERGMEHTMAN